MYGPYGDHWRATRELGVARQQTGMVHLCDLVLRSRQLPDDWGWDTAVYEDPVTGLVSMVVDRSTWSPPSAIHILAGLFADLATARHVLADFVAATWYWDFADFVLNMHDFDNEFPVLAARFHMWAATYGFHLGRPGFPWILAGDEQLDQQFDQHTLMEREGLRCAANRSIWPFRVMSPLRQGWIAAVVCPGRGCEWQ